MIEIQDLSLQRGHKLLLDHCALRIHPGQKIGLIGANGSGKSSLFKLLLGQLQADTGECNIPGNWRLAHMAQEVSHSERRALDYVIDGDQALRALEAQLERENAKGQEACGETLAKLYGDIEQLEGYTAEARAQGLLNGLGFSQADTRKQVHEFSGGWRIRLNLAQALMCPSDFLLLDEPTNHLDLDATVWLEQWLQQYPGTLLIISHDRDFLDNVIQYTVNLHNQKLELYSGNYSSYEKQKAERLAQQQAAFEKQQSRIAEIENFVRRFRAKATKAKQAQSRLKELERMEAIAPAHIDSPFNFQIPVADKLPQTLMNLQQVQLAYVDNVIVDNINLAILPSSRIGLLGHNGAGKSTLMKALANSLEIKSGEITHSEHLAIGYFAQHQLEALDMQASAALHIQRLSPNASEQEIRNFLGGFGFQGDRAFEVIEHFSGGEKARLALAIIAWQKPNVLLLDEPTNHLDLEMRHALTVALQAYEGAIVLVSHDRHLLKNTVEQFILVDKQRAEEFNGTLEDYQHWLGQQAPKQDEPADTQNKSPKADKKEQRQSAAALRQKLQPLRNQIKKIDRDMESSQEKLASVEEKLGDSALYEGDSTELNHLLQEQGELRKKLEQLEEQWLELNEELEALSH
ncbi:ATP-binding cassette domain-containing protein [Pseudoteredinibacter isoporae]|uniref:Probable ATP-binding protein YheS n=1 Tax=Pseudoteredinibacter isoporae TaxID=570281 RepID=A0A7X0MUB2_9GAMM|nr:ATP-binding cassette domain-containing protein [Pseudoteredinibacter isoporae]MBB6520441.1 ATP-binding cassette subfamily F protein 3 [Pseudoteredinibacter isoporae]NHO86008.1 ATP-binding cassette domain-containing protein [Pseudoteredinibacter isoporae]NIB25541.1 ATP-binding cassette domain-containing protein [Pseudoteredinibacter isoporae]